MVTDITIVIEPFEIYPPGPNRGKRPRNCSVCDILCKSQMYYLVMSCKSPYHTTGYCCSLDCAELHVISISISKSI